MSIDPPIQDPRPLQTANQNLAIRNAKKAFKRGAGAQLEVGNTITNANIKSLADTILNEIKVKTTSRGKLSFGNRSLGNLSKELTALKDLAKYMTDLNDEASKKINEASTELNILTDKGGIKESASSKTKQKVTTAVSMTFNSTIQDATTKATTTSVSTHAPADLTTTTASAVAAAPASLATAAATTNVFIKPAAASASTKPTFPTMDRNLFTALKNFIKTNNQDQIPLKVEELRKNALALVNHDKQKASDLIIKNLAVFLEQEDIMPNEIEGILNEINKHPQIKPSSSELTNLDVVKQKKETEMNARDMGLTVTGYNLLSTLTNEDFKEQIPTYAAKMNYDDRNNFLNALLDLKYTTDNTIPSALAAFETNITDGEDVCSPEIKARIDKALAEHKKEEDVSAEEFVPTTISSGAGGDTGITKSDLIDMIRSGELPDKFKTGTSLEVMDYLNVLMGPRIAADAAVISPFLIVSNPLISPAEKKEQLLALFEKGPCLREGEGSAVGFNDIRNALIGSEIIYTKTSQTEVTL